MVKEEKRKFSLFPHDHHRSESPTAEAIQQFAVEQEQQVQGVSTVPPPSQGSPPSKATDFRSQATGSPSKPSSSPSTAPPTAHKRNPHPRGNAARSRRRPLPLPSSSTTETPPPRTRMLKTVPPNQRVYAHCSGPPRSKESK